MIDFRRKAQTFIMGLLLGIVIAGTFFMFRLDNYFKELNFYKNFANTFLSQQSKASDQLTMSEINQSKIKNKKQTEQLLAKNESVKKEQPVTDSLFNMDSILQKIPYSDHIIIRKDELLSVKTVELNKLDPPVSKSHRDSLLEKISEIRDDKNKTGKQFMKVELWKSPLNYKGYKLSKYTVILYGLMDLENLSIYILDDLFYMKQASVIYKLEYNNDFKPYERVMDEEIIKQFNR